MADILGLSTGGGQSQLDQLVAAYKQSQKPRVDKLEVKKKELETRSNFYNTLNSRLNSIVSEVDRFEASTALARFKSNSVESSASEFVTAQASGDAPDGVNTIKVDRLARRDLLITDRVNLEGDFQFSAEETFVFKVGEESYSINVDFSEIDFLYIPNDAELDDEGEPVAVPGLTTERALLHLVEAVNDAGIGINAGLVKDTEESARLTFRSNKTGADNRVSFEDSALLKFLGLDTNILNADKNNRNEASSSKAGYKTQKVDELDSKSVINGVEITRSSNTIDDALIGMSFSLLKVQSQEDAEIILTTQADTESVEGFIQPFLEQYNSVVKLLNSDKSTMRADSSLTSLRTRLRGMLTERITSTNVGSPSYITGIGLSISREGLLEINDSERLKELLQEDPNQVADIFISSNGLISKVSEAISRLKGDEDLLQSRTLSMQNQIDNQQDRIDALNERIDRSAQLERKQFENVLKSYLDAQNQFNAFQAYSSGAT